MQWPVVIQGREVTEGEIQWLAGWISEHFDWSRRRLAGELCLLWNWRDGSGRAKDLAARSFLLKVEQRGWIVLPPLKQAWCKPRAAISQLPEEVPGRVCLEAGFGEVGPVELEVVQAGSEAFRRWAYYLSTHHYLGLRLVGQNMGYLARDRSGREVAALLFGAAAWRCAARDAHLSARNYGLKEGLVRIANNTRFLILPGVRVPHLASHILGKVARRIAQDWRAKYGQTLDWLETFVERDRFAGTCYRAANWVHVGSTCGRGRQDRKHTASIPQKDIYLYRLKA